MRSMTTKLACWGSRGRSGVIARLAALPLPSLLDCAQRMVGSAGRYRGAAEAPQPFDGRFSHPLSGRGPSTAMTAARLTRLTRFNPAAGWKRETPP